MDMYRCVYMGVMYSYEEFVNALYDVPVHTRDIRWIFGCWLSASVSLCA